MITEDLLKECILASDNVIKRMENYKICFEQSLLRIKIDGNFESPAIINIVTDLYDIGQIFESSNEKAKIKINEILKNTDKESMIKAQQMFVSRYPGIADTDQFKNAVKTIWEHKKE